MGCFTSFLYSQLFLKLPIPTQDFSGQTSSLAPIPVWDLEAIRHLSRLDTSLVILAVRNKAKGEAAKNSISESTGREESSVKVWELDIQSYGSIKAFCAQANTVRRLDFVFENAGIMSKNFKIVEVYEAVITTNVIGTFLLALVKIEGIW